MNLSAYVTSITLNWERDSVETTAMGATGHVFAGGLQNISLDVTLNQDFAASTVAPTLDALVGSTTTVVVKPTSAATSATNPTYTISNAFLAAVQPVSGSTGDLASMSISFTGGSLVKTTS
ncbi:MAG: radical SAM protein [Gammaproteobacteria bacterium]|nr:radical SAM protein [Gammaproteobacteria bacterium]